MSLRRFEVVIGVCGLLLVLVVTPASASAILRIEDVTTGVGAVIADNGANDLNPSLGNITFFGNQATIVFTTAGIAGFDLNTSVVPIPEPGTMVLVGAGLFGLASAVRRRIHSKRR